MTAPGTSPPPSGSAQPTPQSNDVGNPGIRLGLRANLAQFSLLVAVNALVGGTLGQERTVVPLLAENTFHLAAFTSALTFILAFGAVKAVAPFTYPFNMSGIPAVTVPCGFNSAGLPIGLQFLGSRNADWLVISAARAYQEASPLTQHRPAGIGPRGRRQEREES